MALYSSALEMKVVNISRNYEVVIITVKPKASLLSNVSIRIHPLTFINEVLPSFD